MTIRMASNGDEWRLEFFLRAISNASVVITYIPADSFPRQRGKGGMGAISANAGTPPSKPSPSIEEEGASLHQVTLKATFSTSSKPFVV